MRDFSARLIYTKAKVKQIRNEHDLMSDFKQEVEGYLRVKEFVGLLDNFKTKKGSDNLSINLKKLYKVLIKNHFFKEEEMIYLDAWLYDVPNIPWNTFSEVFAIDGGSNDGTQELLKNYEIPVYTQKLRGYNGAYLEAFERFNGDAIVFFHPKGTIWVGHLKTMAEHLIRKHDLVIASRMIEDSINEEDKNFIRPRKIFGKFLGLAAWLKWSADLEMIKHLYVNRFSYSEFPVQESSRIKGSTHFPALRTGKFLLKFLIFER
jgi:hypothetical protein